MHFYLLLPSSSSSSLHQKFGSGSSTKQFQFVLAVTSQCLVTSPVVPNKIKLTNWTHLERSTPVHSSARQLILQLVKPFSSALWAVCARCWHWNTHTIPTASHCKTLYHSNKPYFIRFTSGGPVLYEAARYFHGRITAGSLIASDRCWAWMRWIGELYSGGVMRFFWLTVCRIWQPANVGASEAASWLDSVKMSPAWGCSRLTFYIPFLAFLLYCSTLRHEGPPDSNFYSKILHDDLFSDCTAFLRLHFCSFTNIFILSTDNRLIRPSKNHSYKLIVNIGLKLTQIIDIVSAKSFVFVLPTILFL